MVQPIFIQVTTLYIRHYIIIYIYTHTTETVLHMYIYIALFKFKHYQGLFFKLIFFKLLLSQMLVFRKLFSSCYEIHVRWLLINTLNLKCLKPPLNRDHLSSKTASFILFTSICRLYQLLDDNYPLQIVVFITQTDL